jgi:hypothetical protein
MHSSFAFACMSAVSHANGQASVSCMTPPLADELCNMANACLDASCKAIVDQVEADVRKVCTEAAKQGFFSVKKTIVVVSIDNNLVKRASIYDKESYKIVKDKVYGNIGELLGLDTVKVSYKTGTGFGDDNKTIRQ